jgi:hypothetical protein
MGAGLVLQNTVTIVGREDFELIHVKNRDRRRRLASRKARLIHSLNPQCRARIYRTLKPDTSHWTARTGLIDVRFTPKADIGTQLWDVCFVPKADIREIVIF